MYVATSHWEKLMNWRFSLREDKSAKVCRGFLLLVQMDEINAIRAGLHAQKTIWARIWFYHLTLFDCLCLVWTSCQHSLLIFCIYKIRKITILPHKVIVKILIIKSWKFSNGEPKKKWSMQTAQNSFWNFSMNVTVIVITVAAISTIT